MKTNLLFLLSCILCTNTVEAQDVLICKSWDDASDFECKSSDDDRFSGDYSIFKIYKQGWHLVTAFPQINASRDTNKKSLFIFERQSK